MEINKLTKDLVKRDGIWYPSSKSAISYPENGNEDCMQIEDKSFWFSHRNRCIISVVKHFSPDKIFWDIGGGNGFIAKGLQNNGIESVLVEPGESGALNARKRGIKNIICSTLENIGLEDQVVEAAGMFDVVEHIKDDVAFLNTVGNAMPQNGMVYITVPAYRFIWSQEDDYSGHYRRYTVKSANALLEKCGFEPVYSTYLFSALPFPIFLLRTIPTLIGIKLKQDLTKQTAREHSGKGTKSGIMSKILHWEFNRLNALKKIPFGSSCFVVGRKK